MMKITGTEEHERRQAARDAVDERSHRRAQREAAQRRPPLAGIETVEAERRSVPRGIEIEIHSRHTT